jgi:hypothetical protein
VRKKKRDEKLFGLLWGVTSNTKKKKLRAKDRTRPVSVL